MNLFFANTPNPNQCYRPSAANNLNINLTSPSAGVTISVNPFIFLMPENWYQSITVTNNSSSSSAANNVTATIPTGSNISVQSNTCGSSLAIGQNCTITFASTTQEGPTIIPVKGDNTNTAYVYLAVTDRPLISITGPVQQTRIVPTDGVTTLNLDITNNADSIFNANKTACPNLSVDSSDCTSLAPSSTCQLRLSTTTPYAPCNITISGSNTGNSPTTLVAFSYLGGLVFEQKACAIPFFLKAGQASEIKKTIYLIILFCYDSFHSGTESLVTSAGRGAKVRHID